MNAVKFSTMYLKGKAFSINLQENVIPLCALCIVVPLLNCKHYFIRIVGGWKIHDFVKNDGLHKVA